MGRLSRAGVECTVSYDAAPSRYLHGRGITVFEVNQSDKATRQRRGKSDIVDAEAVARAVITGRATATAKAGDGPVEMLRLCKMESFRDQVLRQSSRSKPFSWPPAFELRETLAGLSSPKLIRACAGLDSPAAGTVGAAATRSNCWPGGSSSSPKRSKTSPHGSQTSSRSS
ncbi:hypothetical protein ACFCYM_35580 [Streptomyces sp. NPDC056254]|uniref:hypothetical protein n=1 Tax=Streptomyces sp. NPDC056254 TaxID=3345763 RepID=UPI0035DE8439